MPIRRSRIRPTCALSVAVLVLACLGGAHEALSSESAAAMGYQYLSPLPGSGMVSPENNIAIRQGGELDAGTLGAAPLVVVGSQSGEHPGECRLSDDARTLIFLPHQAFTPGETVSVSLLTGVRTRGGASLPPLSFEFTVASQAPRSWPRVVFDMPEPATSRPAGATPAPASTQPPMSAASDLPANFPKIVFLAYDHPAPGDLFLTPRSNEVVSPLLIIDDLGMPIFYRHRATDLANLSKQPNGLLTYFDLSVAKWYALDSLYAVVDSFTAANGYYADHHDFQLLPNGHALVLIYDTQPVDMSQVVPGGDPDALVYGLVIQELDTAKNVVFQWRSWDHFQITDALNVDLTAPTIDYVHGNTIELDDDGTLMISSRSLNEITKIDHQTGDIIWRWGLNSIHNDFTFVGDTRGFGHQHDIRRSSPGHVTLFDNGWVLNPPYARALEYALDEQNKTATLVWELLPDGGGAAHSNGSVQKRADGGILVDWGAGSVVPAVTDLNPDGSKGLEFTFDPLGMTSYKAYRSDWKGMLLATDHDAIDFGYVQQDGIAATTLHVKNNGPADLVITSFVITDTTHFFVTTPVPMTIPRGATVAVPVYYHATETGVAQGRLYVRSSGADELVARTVDLTGIGISLTGAPSDPTPSSLSLSQSRPNPARSAVAIPFSLARAGAVSLRVYDSSGRVVATLIDGALAAGDHVARWDGARGDGTKVSPGEYFYELRQSGERVQRRMILLR